MQERISAITADEAKITGILSGRTKLEEAELPGLFLQGETKDPTFALEKGIIHEIREVHLPKDAPLFSCNFKP